VGTRTTTTKGSGDLPWEWREERLLKLPWEFSGDGKEELGWLVEEVPKVERGTRREVVEVGRKIVAAEGWGCRELDLLGSNRRLVERREVEVAAAAAGERRGPAAAEELVAVVAAAAEDGEE